eukprot:TRINITY_DN90738_c0_g1_i1.p1 TRINITY_DN90738_c0_g1~~TRINITY_DN90738_c0_g1_i1.p1  ORF type:complete len:1527 (+),score=527.42 TRINITY_DN90738_c0_g1_i1:97-4581(+)
MRSLLVTATWTAYVATAVRVDDDVDNSDGALPALASANQLAAQLLASSSSSSGAAGVTATDGIGAADTAASTQAATPVPTAFIHFASPAPTASPTPGVTGHHMPWQWPWETHSEAEDIDKVSKATGDKMQKLTEENAAARAGILEKVAASKKEAVKNANDAHQAAIKLDEEGRHKLGELRKEEAEDVKKLDGDTAAKLSRIQKQQAATSADIQKRTQDALVQSKSSMTDEVQRMNQMKERATKQAKEANQQLHATQQQAEEEIQQLREANAKQVEHIKDIGEAATKAASAALAKSTQDISKIRDKEVKDVAAARADTRNQFSRLTKAKQAVMQIQHDTKDALLAVEKHSMASGDSAKAAQARTARRLERIQEDKEKVMKEASREVRDINRKGHEAVAKERSLTMTKTKAYTLAQTEAEDISKMGKRVYDEMVRKEAAERSRLGLLVSHAERDEERANLQLDRVKDQSVKELKRRQEESDSKVQKLEELQDAHRKQSLDDLAATSMKVKKSREYYEAQVRENEASTNNRIESIEKTATLQEQHAEERAQEAVHEVQSMQAKASLNAREEKQQLADRLAREKESAHFVDQHLALAHQAAIDGVDDAKKAIRKSLLEEEATDKERIKKAQRETKLAISKADAERQMAQKLKTLEENEAFQAEGQWKQRIRDGEEHVKEAQDKLAKAKLDTSRAEERIKAKSALAINEANLRAAETLKSLERKKLATQREVESNEQKMHSVRESIPIDVQKIEDNGARALREDKEATVTELQARKESFVVEQSRKLHEAQDQSRKDIKKAKENYLIQQSSGREKEVRRDQELTKLEKELNFKVEAEKAALAKSSRAQSSGVLEQAARIREASKAWMAQAKQEEAEEAHQMKQTADAQIARSDSELAESLQRLKESNMQKDKDLVETAHEHRQEAVRKVGEEDSHEVGAIQKRTELRLTGLRDTTEAEMKAAHTAIAQAQAAGAGQNQKEAVVAKEQADAEARTSEYKAKLNKEVREATAKEAQRVEKLRAETRRVLDENKVKQVAATNEVNYKLSQANGLKGEMRGVVIQTQDAKHDALLKVNYYRQEADNNVNLAARDRSETRRIKAKNEKRMNSLLHQGESYKKLAEGEIESNLNDIQKIRREEQKVSARVYSKIRIANDRATKKGNALIAAANKRADLIRADAQQYSEAAAEDMQNLRSRLGDRIHRANLQSQVQMQAVVNGERHVAEKLVDSAKKNIELNAAAAADAQRESNEVMAKMQSYQAEARAVAQDKATAYEQSVRDSLKIAGDAARTHSAALKPRLQQQATERVKKMQEVAEGYIVPTKEWTQEHLRHTEAGTDEIGAYQKAGELHTQNAVFHMQNTAADTLQGFKDRVERAHRNLADTRDQAKDAVQMDKDWGHGRVDYWDSRRQKKDTENAIKEGENTIEAAKAKQEAVAEAKDQKHFMDRVKQLEAAAKAARDRQIPEQVPNPPPPGPPGATQQVPPAYLNVQKQTAWPAPAPSR